LAATPAENHQADSFNKCFINWVQSFLPNKELTIPFDGKTIRSTENICEGTKIARIKHFRRISVVCLLRANEAIG
jgi:hypothetical protein